MISVVSESLLLAFVGGLIGAGLAWLAFDKLKFRAAVTMENLSLAFPDMSEAERKLAFANVYRELTTRIEILVALPVEQLDRLTLQRRVREMGQKPRQPA